MEIILAPWFMLFHIAVSIIAIFILLPYGIYYARYYKRKIIERSLEDRNKWLIPHSTIMFISGLSILISTAVMMCSISFHGRSLHCYVGYLIVILIVFVQPNLGSLDMPIGTNYTRKRFKLHRRLGYIMAALLVINVLLGFIRLDAVTVEEMK